MKYLSEEQVISLARVPLRQSVFEIPFEEIARRVAANPWTKSVHVSRRLPDTIVLQVEERIPIATVRGDRLMILTADSIAITPPAEEWVWDLPILSPTKPVRMEHGGKVTDGAVLSLLYQAALARACSPKVWTNISEFYFSRSQIRAVMDHPRAEIIAGSNASPLAWASLQALIEQLPNDSAGVLTVVDLRIPGKLTVAQELKETMEQKAG